MSYVKGILRLVFLHIVVIIQVELSELEPSSFLQRLNYKVCQRDKELCKLWIEKSVETICKDSSFMCCLYQYEGYCSIYMNIYKTTTVWVAHAC